MATDDTTRDADEPFLARWSRRKQQALTKGGTADNRSAALATPAPNVPTAGAVRSDTKPDGSASPPATDPAAEATPKQLTAEDFADVDFTKLDYNSDYGRFLQTGVPESIRQKALTQLWHSDAMFTDVDPFQDYAGDFTDAATVPKGLVKTAYKVGQGFLSDDEAHEWDRLGKPPVADDLAALPVLRPGYRVRVAVAEDAAAILAVHVAAIQGPGADSYGRDIADSWAAGLTPEGYVQAIQGGENFEIAVDENNGGIVGFASIQGDEVKAVYTMPGHGRRGLASRLLERGEARMRVEGIMFARLQSSLPARALYQQRGYLLVEEAMCVSRGGLPMQTFLMRKWLITADDVSIDAETPDQPEVLAFFAASEAYMGGLYPAESNHFAPVTTLLQPNVLFLVARANDTAVGCGAIVKSADGKQAEIKRMWVDPAARGLKVGIKLLDALIAAARDDGIELLQLETGIEQPDAIGLYRRAGFVECPPFGSYLPDPLSLFMELKIGAAVAAK